MLSLSTAMVPGSGVLAAWALVAGLPGVDAPVRVVVNPTTLLPYAGYDLSMAVLLPGEVDGLEALEGYLSAENLTWWTKGMWSTEVEVFLPRFEITCPFGLGAALKSMGVVDAF